MRVTLIFCRRFTAIMCRIFKGVRPGVNKKNKRSGNGGGKRSCVGVSVGNSSCDGNVGVGTKTNKKNRRYKTNGKDYFRAKQCG